MAFETQTYQSIIGRVLGRMPSNLDKREGSLAWDAAGPAALEIAALYTALDFILLATYADTAPREYLVLRAAERGEYPKAAGYAIFRADFDVMVPIGSRYSLQDLNYIVTERMEEEDTATTYAYRARCETAGLIGNSLFGALIPIEYIDGLTYAALAELLIPGADEEDTEAFRARYIAGLTAQAFGGNIADYKDKVLSLPGVGAVKVFPAWNSDMPPQIFIPSTDVTAWYQAILPSLTAPLSRWLTAVYTAAANQMLTVGGTVKLVIMDSVFGVPTADLLSDVQEAVDPPGYYGEGRGIAPIGHVVKVEGVQSSPVDITLMLQYQSGWDWAAVQSYVNAAIDDYFGELAQGWQDTGSTIVRISQIETRVLSCPGLLDVHDTQLNGAPGNVILDGTHIPVRGGVVG